MMAFAGPAFSVKTVREGVVSDVGGQQQKRYGMQGVDADTTAKSGHEQPSILAIPCDIICIRSVLLFLKSTAGVGKSQMQWLR